MAVTATTGTISVIAQSGSVEAVSARTAALCGNAAESWSADDLEWYVREEILRLHGPQLPKPGEARMVPDFFRRFGADSVRIARHVFEARRGMWKGAPVTLARFSVSNDDFFARPLLQEISAT